jgi:hypothetical protein
MLLVEAVANFARHVVEARCASSLRSPTTGGHRAGSGLNGRNMSFGLRQDFPMGERSSRLAAPIRRLRSLTDQSDASFAASGGDEKRGLGIGCSVCQRRTRNLGQPTPYCWTQA